jgi:oligopeptide/dipeptide ABC transporter ATP-binding protein
MERLAIMASTGSGSVVASPELQIWGWGIDPSTVLELEGLVTAFDTPGGRVRAVDGVSLRVAAGRTLCIAGESGCGKSVTALSIMGLLADKARIEAGRIVFRGRDLVPLSPTERRRLRGRELAMIFQEPLTALNPVLPVGEQVAEVFRIHGTAGPKEARERALALFEQVHIPDAARRFGEYPHQLSGGMKQRVTIAMALAHRPALLIADEPTTALDVTIQAQVLNLLAELQREIGMAMVFVTHDLAVVAQIADEVAVMYAGRVVERAPVAELFERPAHPYTRGLLASRPRPGQTRHDGTPLPSIRGSLPPLGQRAGGCAFRDRCPMAEPRCALEQPALRPVAPAHEAACLLLEAA